MGIHHVGGNKKPPSGGWAKWDAKHAPNEYHSYAEGQAEQKALKAKIAKELAAKNQGGGSMPASKYNKPGALNYPSTKSPPTSQPSKKSKKKGPGAYGGTDSYVTNVTQYDVGSALTAEVLASSGVSDDQLDTWCGLFGTPLHGLSAGEVAKIRVSCDAGHIRRGRRGGNDE